MRIQLAFPEARFLSADLYNQVFTVHGTNMMFLFAVPVMEAVAIYVVPLMVGTRNIAFARLNAFSYWIYLCGGLLLWTSLLLQMAPDVGWFAYAPLAGPQYGYGKRADIWAQTVTFTEIAALAVAVELVVTILKQRAPGMTLDRIPLFAWAMLVTSFLVILAMPAIMVASTTLILDRLVGTHFYNPPREAMRCCTAPVLVLRPPRGLHHLPAGGRHGLDHPADLLPQARLRLPRDRAGADRDGHPLLGLRVHHMFVTACRSSARASSRPPA